MNKLDFSNICGEGYGRFSYDKDERKIIDEFGNWECKETGEFITKDNYYCKHECAIGRELLLDILIEDYENRD